MPPFRDLTGHRFGRLVALMRSHVDDNGNSYWLCRCDCQTEKSIKSQSLTGNLTKSCGCFNREAAGQRITRHSTVHGYGGRGKKRTPEYRAWAAMKNRCENKKDKRYADWGGRGINIFTPWRNFQTFLTYLLTTIGLRPSPQHSLDRINNNIGYFPGNIRWATRKEQANNRRPQRKGN